MLPDFHRSLNATLLALQQLNTSLAALPLGLTIPQLGTLMLQLNFTQIMPKTGETSAVAVAALDNVGTKWNALPVPPTNDPQNTLLTNMKNNMIDVTILDSFMNALRSAYEQLQAMPTPNGLDSHCATLHGQVETLRTQLDNAQTELNQRPSDWETSGFTDATKTPLLNAIQAVEDTMNARPASNFTSALLTQLGVTVGQMDDPASWMTSWSNLETECESATDFAALLTAVTTVTDAMQAEPLLDATLGTEAHPLMKALADAQTLLLTPVGTGTVLTKMDTLFATIQSNANQANSTLEDSSIKLGMLALGAKQANIANNLLIDVNMFNQQLPDIDGMVDNVRSKFQDVRDAQEQMVETRNDYNYNRNLYKLQADEYDGHRVLLFDIIFLVPLLFAIFGGIGCLFGKGCPVMWMALSFFPFMALFFLFSAILMVPSVITSDICIPFEKFGHANLANVVVIKNDSFNFVQLDGDVTAINVFDYYMLGHVDAEPTLRKKLVPRELMMKQNLNLSEKVDEIQQSIKDTGLKLFDGLDSDFALMHSFVNRFENLVDGVYELSATQEFYPAFASLKSSFCDKGFASMATAACIYFFMGLCLCPGVILGVRGYKRLDKRNWTDTKPEDLQQPMEENEDDEVVELEGGKPEKYDNPLHQIDAKAAPKEDDKANAKSSVSKKANNKTVHIVDPMEMKIPASNAGDMVVNTSPSIEMQSMGSLSSSPSDASLPIVAPVSISVSVSSSASAAPVKRKPVLRGSVASKPSISQPGAQASESSAPSQTPVRYSVKLHRPSSASGSPPQNNDSSPPDYAPCASASPPQNADNPPDYTIKDLPPASSLELAQMGAVAFDENGNPLSVQP